MCSDELVATRVSFSVTPSDTFRTSPHVLMLHGHGGGGGCRCGGLLRCDLGQPVLCVLQAAPAAQLTGGTAGVAARQEATHTHSPDEPPGRPAAPAKNHWASQNSQNHVERQQRHVRWGIWGKTRGFSGTNKSLFLANMIKLIKRRLWIVI